MTDDVVQARLDEIGKAATLTGDHAYRDWQGDTGPVARNAAAWAAERRVWREQVRTFLARVATLEADGKSAQRVAVAWQDKALAYGQERDAARQQLVAARRVWEELVVLVGCTSPDGSAELDQVRYFQEREKAVQERIETLEAEDFVRVEYPSGNWAGNLDVGIADALVQHWNAATDENQQLHILAAPQREEGKG